MGDLMHAEVEAQWIRQVILTMIRTPRHTYQILTKRPARLLTFAWPVNCWVGVTVESRKHITRIDDLRMTKAQIRFVSFEPLLEGIPSRILDLRQIDWVIVGAETGPGKRPMKPAWASNIGWQCLDADVPFFFKRGSDGRRELFGHRYEEMPSFNGGGYQCRNAR
jgi:protein gp37